MSTHSSEPIVFAEQELDLQNRPSFGSLSFPEGELPYDRSEPITQLSDINLSFGQGDAQVQVLQEINLELQTGDFICVLGSSGCGKTTLLRVLAGYQKPTAGLVTVAGRRCENS